MANMENDPKAKEVLDQEVSKEDLDAVAGGGELDDDTGTTTGGCRDNHYRSMYGGRGFPNCASSVEDGSHCGTNDACYSDAVVYEGMGGCSISDCKKSWR